MTEGSSDQCIINYDEKNIKVVESFDSLAKLVNRTLILKKRDDSDEAENQIFIGNVSMEENSWILPIHGIECVADPDGKIIFCGLNYKPSRAYRANLIVNNFDYMDIFYLDS